MFVSFFAVCSALFLGFSNHATAAPTVGPTELIAYGPQILTPTAGTIWRIGTQASVTWNTSAVPSDAKDHNITVYLGYLYNDSPNEHLNIAGPLAVGIPIMTGVANFPVPNVSSGDNYIAVALGDSGDSSPMFSIQ